MNSKLKDSIHSCLSDPELKHLLDFENDDIHSQDEASWSLHLEECNSCRIRLERLAGNEDEWKQTIDRLSRMEGDLESPETPEFQSSFLYQVEFLENQRNVNSGSEPVDQETENKTKLNPVFQSLLDPPRHPENFGRIDRYEIEKTIGHGGMGVVFKGFDAELNRTVAVKILLPQFSGQGTARQRFAREAKAAAAVVHDNVVPIYDIQSDGSRPFLVMPFVSGFSLQEYIDRHGVFDSKDLLRVALQIASGLAAAHAQGLIHRDIKPGNILLENELNRVQLTDFGLARAIDDAAMTQSGLIAGTPHYMSPEQAKGHQLDHRSDLFSLGCVMYFMATGRTVFHGPTPYSVIAQLTRNQYTPVRELNAEIPVYVSDIIDKLLESNPQHRFQTAHRLIQRIEKSLSHLHQPTVVPAPDRLWSSRRKRYFLKRSLMTFGCVGVLFLCLMVFLQPGASGTETGREAQTTESSLVSHSANTSEPLAQKAVPSHEDITVEILQIRNGIAEIDQLIQSDKASNISTPANWNELDQLSRELDLLGSKLQADTDGLFSR